MANNLTLDVQPRDLSMKASALRRAGYVPSVLYARESPTVSLQSEHLATERLVRRAGMNHFVSLSIPGQDEEQLVLFREIQRDPVTGTVIHLDMLKVIAGQVISLDLSLRFVGQAIDVTANGGSVVTALTSVQIECLPKDVPDYVVVDLSKLKDFGDAITVAELEFPEAVTVLTEPDTEVVRAMAPRSEEEEVAEEELAEGEEGEEGAAEGEEAADDAGEPAGDE